MSHHDFESDATMSPTGGESNETSDERTRDRHGKARVSRGEMDERGKIVWRKRLSGMT